MSLAESAEIHEAVSRHDAPLVVGGPERAVEERRQRIGTGMPLPYPVTRGKLLQAVAAALESPPAT
jgi:hypothetical protein